MGFSQTIWHAYCCDFVLTYLDNRYFVSEATWQTALQGVLGHFSKSTRLLCGFTIFQDGQVLDSKTLRFFLVHGFDYSQLVKDKNVLRNFFN